ncbi:MAG: ligase-associated DNA damage response endonuclease PdeM [Burkholderiales bacterium]
MMPIEVAGESLLLHPEKAVYWPRESTLFVADIHFGKVAAFRAAGLPLPPGSTSAALDRLDRAVADAAAQRIVFLGDFLHSRDARAAQTFARFAKWRESHAAMDITLIRGNHDAKAGDPPFDWRVTCIDEGEMLGPFCLAHHPAPDPRGYVLAGHVHPAIRLQGPANDALRLPCFWFGESVAVLPAFGEFTGTYTVQPKSGDRVFVVADGRMVEIRA